MGILIALVIGFFVLLFLRATSDSLGITKSKFIECPYCLSLVNRKAKICKHCHKEINEEKEEKKLVIKSTRYKSNFKKNEQKELYFLLILIVIILVIFYGTQDTTNEQHIESEKKMFIANPI